MADFPVTPIKPIEGCPEASAVLPATYGDSLTLYEAIAKVAYQDEEEGD